MLPASIATSVAPETISKVTRLFNGSATDVVNELLQNARRAGAASITISTTGTPGSRLLHIADDGSGIDDPATVVTLGRSGWSDETRAREDPAGMGVFSLAGRDVMIRSWSKAECQGWCAHIPASAWESCRPIAITNDPIQRGTTITIRLPDEWARTLSVDLANAARHYPLPVTFDGLRLERQPWLAGAVHVEDWNGSRIGIFREMHKSTSTHDPRLNFHGVTIPCDLQRATEIGGVVWTARVDIIDTPEIQLVLPARKEAVQNAALTDLQQAVRAALFRAIGAQPGHRLPFADWLEAESVGVSLPEAEATLPLWTPRCADSNNSYTSSEMVQDPSMVVMSGFDAIVEQPFSLALAGQNPFGGKLVEPEARFAGYGWYDVLAKIEQIDFAIERDGRRFTVSDSLEASPDEDSGFADAITVEATLSHAGASVTITLDSDIAFAPDQFLCNSADETVIYIRKGTTLSSADVAELFERAVFEPHHDSGSDSYDTQQERFEREAMARAIDLMEGSDAALEAAIRTQLQYHAWTIPADRTVTIVATRAGLEVTIAELPTEAA